MLPATAWPTSERRAKVTLASVGLGVPLGFGPSPTPEPLGPSRLVDRPDTRPLAAAIRSRRRPKALIAAGVLLAAAAAAVPPLPRLV